MNLLVVYPYIPYPLDRGTYQRTFHLLRELAREHTIDFIALSEGGERLEQRGFFAGFCRSVTFIPFHHPPWPRLFPDRLLHLTPSTIRHWQSPELASAIRDHVRRHHYDLVHVCDLVMAEYFMKEHRHLPLSIDRSRVDLQFQQQQTAFQAGSLKDKALAWENIAKMWLYERRVARRCQLQVLCGPDDETFVRRHISRDVPVKVVANGVDPAFFIAPEAQDERGAGPRVMFCGAMDYMPNTDALRWFFSEIHDRILERVPDLRIDIVGKSPTAEVLAYQHRRGVAVTGSVPDVRPYYRRAWLQIVPLRIGGGTRLKIVESLCIGTPVVSTTIGAQGLGTAHNDDILLADTAEAFAAEVVRALQDAPLRDRLRASGIRKARDSFAWRSIGAGLAATYRQLQPQRPDRVTIMDVPFDRVTMPQTMDRISAMVQSRQPHYLATANVDFLVQARRDAQLRAILNGADLVVCDGTPVVWLSRLMGKGLPERVAGSDLVPQLLEKAENEGWSIYFLGGQPEVLAAAVRNACQRHPRLRIAGSHSPDFAPLETMDHEGICGRIRAARPDILLVAFGCPKQEKWIARNYQAAGVPVCAGVGATIDFLAGHMKRAPRWMHGLGLEWVYRLAQEPRRLFKRYATDLVVFGCGAVRELLKGRNSARA